MSVVDTARAWLAQDPDTVTRDELAALIARAAAGDASAVADLDDRFRGRLTFGTAGLRGRLGAGSNRMNRVVVAQAAAGLAAYLRAQAEARGDGTAPSVVIGYDGRRNSDVFARDSAEIFAGAGLRAVLLPRMLPTPVLAFAVRHLDASAGVMVTASHNPPDDNGYKVYLGGGDAGAQIVPPADAAIAARIAEVADAGDIGALPRSTAYEVAGDDVVDAYVAATAAVGPAPAHARGMRVVYTAMHGVGYDTFARVLDAAGYDPVLSVPQQNDPDGTFPTVAFPNPEEPGAMDLALALARDVGAELVIAHDPDADRLAVGLPADDEPGGWRMLTGNQVGLLLGWRAARAHEGEAGASLACSLVSSPGLATVAERYGLAFHATLTGFKWISRAPGIVFGFEEALGYLVNPETVRDKDGISAAVAALHLAAEARGEGSTMADLVTRFQDEFGFFTSGQVALRVTDVAVIGEITAALRAAPPAQVGTVRVERVEDLLVSDGVVPPSDILILWLVDGSRVIVRPSGTEPKLKVYLDARGASAADAAARLAALEAGAHALLAGARGA